MKVTINLKYLAVMILSYGISIGTIYGVIQEYIPFQAPLNELAFAIGFFMFGTFCLFGIFEKPKKEGNDKK